ncbi:isoflavone reductase [Apiospora kogelbergensis]|uniref:isoflavone reductase n=1 Tax=Apiospora kogelbergensis TaxID=1337665 RepID=UPI00312F21D4
MVIENVALLGATGDLGAPMLEVLITAGTFNITVLQRRSSKLAPRTHPSVRTVTVDDDMSLGSLQGALQGQDAVIASFRPRDVDVHLRLADAAAAAGVARFIPADFGSCDSSSERVQELVPLFLAKVRVRQRLQELAAEKPEFTWTSFVTGHLFDWGLKENFLHFNLKTRTADILDDGKYRSSTSTLKRVSEAVAKVLQHEEIGRNRMLFVQSFCVSQLDVLASLEKATGDKWKVNWLDSEQFIKESKAKADAGDKEAVKDLVFALGAVDGDWEGKDDFAMEALGLKNEDLDTIVRRVVSETT